MSEVLLDVANGVATITLNARERRNALTHEMARELVSACERIDSDLSVGAVVLKANGEAFCSGAHRAILDAAGKDPASPENYSALNLMYAAFVRVGELLPP